MPTTRRDEGRALVDRVIAQGDWVDRGRLDDAIVDLCDDLAQVARQHKTGSSDDWELISKMRMFKLVTERVFRGVP
jgi:hypothetical protein